MRGAADPAGRQPLAVHAGDQRLDVLAAGTKAAARGRGPGRQRAGSRAEVRRDDGDMGRTYDGGYAEYTSVPLSQVIPVDTDPPWEVLGGLPEKTQTAYGRSPSAWTSSPVSPC